MDRVIALTADTETFYLVPTQPFGDYGYGRRPTWTNADGATLTSVRGHWYTAPGPVQDLTATRAGQGPRTGWKLRDPDTASAKYPPTLTNAEFTGRGFDDEGEYPAGHLYQAVYADVPDESITFPAADMLVIDDAAPAPADGLTWTVNIRDELRQHPELFHLFPGHLSGLRAAFVEAVKALPFMSVGLFRDYVWDDKKRPGHVEVIHEAPYEPRSTVFVHDTTASGKRLKRGRTVVEAKRMSVSVPVSDRVYGNTRAEAKAVWEAELAGLLDAVTEALTPAPCLHCRGTGVVSQVDAPAAAS